MVLERPRLDYFPRPAKQVYSSLRRSGPRNQRQQDTETALAPVHFLPGFQITLMRFLNFVGLCLLTSACAPITATSPNETVAPGSNNPFTEAKTEATESDKKATADADEQPDPVAESLAYLQNDKIGLALTKIDQALLDRPNDVQALNVAGMVYEQMGDVDTALIHLSNAVFAKPDDPYSRNNYGALLCRLGQQREAIEQFERAARIEAYDNPEVAFTNAGLCAMRVPDVELAEKYFNRALHLNPGSPVALYQIAKISYLQNRFVAAREDLQHYLRVAPHTPKTLLLRAQIENSLGNDTARDAYTRRLSDLFPESSEARLALALESPDALTRRLNAERNPEALPVTERINCPQTAESSQQADKPSKPAPKEKPSAAKPPSKPLQAGASTASKKPLSDTTTTTRTSTGEVRNSDWLASQQANRYTIQLRAQRDRADLLKFARESELGPDAAIFSFLRDGETWHALLYSDFDSAEEAELAARTLLPKLRQNQPWIRQFGEIQALISKSATSAETRTQ